MRRRILVRFLLLLTALLVACNAGQPDIEVAADYDFGSVSKGEVVTADLAVRNLGTSVLTVAAVSTSCGCTTATLSPMVIPPGEEGTLHVEYDSAAHDTDVGQIERYIFITSDDPQQQDVSVKLKAIVETETGP